MVSMELVSVIRHKVLTEGVPIRDVARQLGLSRNTIRRYVRAKVVPVPRPLSPPRPASAREQVAEAAAAIWAARRTFTAGKQRLTATRLWELLRDDGHDVGARTVRRLVASFQVARLARYK
jgi:transposase